MGTLRDDDGESSLALAVQGAGAVAYACGDDPRHESYRGWLVDGGSDEDNRVRLTRGEWTFEGSWDATHAEGHLTGPAGVDLAWSAAAADERALAGLYVALDSGCLTGVIVHDDPAATMRGAWCSASGEVLQVTPIRPIQIVDGQILVSVALGPRSLWVAPVRLPVPRP